MNTEIPFDLLTPYEQQSYQFRVIAAERLAERKNCSGAAVEWGGVARNDLTASGPCPNSSTDERKFKTKEN